MVPEAQSGIWVRSHSAGLRPIEEVLLHLLPVALLAFAAAAIGTRAMIPWLASRGALAHENERTLHKGIVPKGGGLPLLMAALGATALLFPLGEIPSALLTGLMLVMAVSWLDDTAPLPARVRFPVHIAAAAILILTLPRQALVFQGLVPLWADRALAILTLTWMMNLFNFMDGINGIAGAETMSIAGGYLLVGAVVPGGVSLAPLSAALLGATAGFLIWNLRERGEAAVFMGDIGSVPLGYLTGAMMIDLAVRGHWVPALILPAYFLADATLTLLKRMARGEKFWQAHKSHFYQRAAEALGNKHLPVVWRISAANATLLACALWGVSFPLPALIAAAITVTLLLILLSVARVQA